MRTAIFRTLLVLLTLAPAAWAQSQSPWTPFGPGGGPVVSLAVDPGDEAVVYAVGGSGSLTSGWIYKSTDGGITWTGLRGGGLRLVAVAPDRPGTVYAAGPFSLLRSTNGGRTWSALTLPNGRFGARALAAAPGGVVFAGNEGLLLRSANGGATWAAVAGDGSGAVSIQVDPSDPSRVYYASGSRIYESVDGGSHWSPTGQPAAGGISAFALAPSDPDRLYALWYADGRIFRSDDGARTWQAVGQVPAGGVPALAVDPGSPDRVYVANGVGLFRSEDGGASWQPAFNGLPRFLDQPPAVLTVEAAPSRPGVLYAGTSDGGVARSVDSGGHWRAGLQLGLSATFTSLLKFNPLRPNVVYLGQGSFGDRSYRSTDGGRTWQGFARAVTQQGWNDLAFDPADPDLLYAATNAAIWRSGDGGATWDRISDQTPLKLAAPGGRTLLASRCGMSRSTDGGRTWREVIACNGDHGSPRYPLSLWTDPGDPGTVYVHFAIFGSGSVDSRYEIFRSRDGGATWTKLGGPEAPVPVRRGAGGLPRPLCGGWRLPAPPAAAEPGRRGSLDGRLQKLHRRPARSRRHGRGRRRSGHALPRGQSAPGQPRRRRHLPGGHRPLRARQDGGRPALDRPRPARARLRGRARRRPVRGPVLVVRGDS